MFEENKSIVHENNNVDVINNTKLNNNVPIRNMNSPHGSFGFGKKLDLFKSNFDKNLAKVSCSPKTTAQFKPLKPTKEKLNNSDSESESLINDNKMELSDAEKTQDIKQGDHQLCSVVVSSGEKKPQEESSMRTGSLSDINMDSSSLKSEQSSFFSGKRIENEGSSVRAGSIVDLTNENSNDSSKVSYFGFTFMPLLTSRQFQVNPCLNIFQLGGMFLLPSSLAFDICHARKLLTPGHAAFFI